MIDMLLHKVGLGPPPKPEDHKRSPQWQAFCKHFLEGKTCAACGTKDNLEGHHMTPFHVDRSRELDPTNIIPLCMKPGHWCHFRLGHLFDWRHWNPYVKADAAHDLNRLHDAKVAWHDAAGADTTVHAVCGAAAASLGFAALPACLGGSGLLRVQPALRQLCLEPLLWGTARF